MNIEEVINSTPRTARSHNFDSVLREIFNRFGESPINIVETGCSRQLDDSGDGWSTLVWKRYIDACSGFMWTVDISEESIAICRLLLERHNNTNNINLVCMDSIKFLEDFERKIHFLYLDSYDTDSKKFCAVHQVNEAKAVLDKMEAKSLILIDDVYGSEGKSEFSVPFLKANGFQIIWEQNSQVFLEKV